MSDNTVSTPFHSLLTARLAQLGLSPADFATLMVTEMGCTTSTAEAESWCSGATRPERWRLHPICDLLGVFAEDKERWTEAIRQVDGIEDIGDRSAFWQSEFEHHAATLEQRTPEIEAARKGWIPPFEPCSRAWLVGDVHGAACGVGATREEAYRMAVAYLCDWLLDPERTYALCHEPPTAAEFISESASHAVEIVTGDPRTLRTILRTLAASNCHVRIDEICGGAR